MKKLNMAAVALSVVALAAVGCGGTQDTAQVNDPEVASRVQSALAANPELQGQQFQVTAEDGKVSLRGTVATEEAKERAEEIAENVQGVRSVDNELEVSGADNEGVFGRAGDAMERGAERTGDAVGIGSDREADRDSDAYARSESTTTTRTVTDQDRVAQSDQNRLGQRDQFGADADRDRFDADRGVADDRRLPQTATNLPLVGLIGLLALVGGVALRLFTRS